MNITMDLHTHTVYSHGRGTMEENILAAIRQGLGTIAISDHGLGHLAYGIKKREMEEYLFKIEGLKEKYQGQIRVLAGIEANLISTHGEIDLPDAINQRMDVVLMGFHRGVKNRNFSQWRRFILYTGNRRGTARRQREKEVNTMAFIRAISRYRIDVITHPGYMARVNLEELAHAAKKTGTLLEINHKHIDVAIPQELMKAKSAGAEFLISSDAHRPERVGVVTDAVRMAALSGITEEIVFNAQGYRGTKRL